MMVEPCVDASKGRAQGINGVVPQAPAGFGLRPLV